jgi:hypothetical protein
VVFVNAPPERFLKMYADVEKLPDGKTYLAAKYFRKPPSAADVSSLSLDADDIAQLRNCEPGDCDVQLPAEEMARIRSGVNWKASNALDQANRIVREFALHLLRDYQQRGNAALGFYQDQSTPVNVSQTFRTILSRQEPARLLSEVHRLPVALPRCPARWYVGFLPLGSGEVRIEAYIPHQPRLVPPIARTSFCLGRGQQTALRVALLPNRS